MHSSTLEHLFPPILPCLFSVFHSKIFPRHLMVLSLYLCLPDLHWITDWKYRDLGYCLDLCDSHMWWSEDLWCHNVQVLSLELEPPVSCHYVSLEMVTKQDEIWAFLKLSTVLLSSAYLDTRSLQILSLSSICDINLFPWAFPWSWAQPTLNYLIRAYLLSNYMILWVSFHSLCSLRCLWFFLFSLSLILFHFVA